MNNLHDFTPYWIPVFHVSISALPIPFFDSAVSGNYNESAIKAMLGAFSLSTTVPGQLSYGTYLKQIVDDANADLSKVRGACAMAYFAAFIYIAMFWYYTIRIYKRGMLKAIADAAVPPAGKANGPPYNV
ncbi:unnamed protein product [Closterium sp. NIES-54]